MRRIGSATAQRRGSIIVLTLVIFIILLVLGLAYHQVTLGVRRDATRTYFRLHATTALENALLEGRALFLARVNQSGIDYRRPPGVKRRRTSLTEGRQWSATKGNDEAFRAFIGRHGGAVSTTVEVGSGAADDDGSISGGKDPWYTPFRQATAAFKAETAVPYAHTLMGRAHGGISFDKLRLKVIDVEEPAPKERKRVLCRGLIAFSATLHVGSEKVTLIRSLEKRYRFALYKIRAPKWVGGGSYSRVVLEEPAVATFLNLHGKEGFGD